MDSEGRIIEVVLGTDLSDYGRRTGDNKTSPKTVRTESRSKRQFGSLVFTPFMTKGLSRSNRDRE